MHSTRTLRHVLTFDYFALADEFDHTLREQCGCPVPCHFAIYDPSVSYASISNHLVKKLLTSDEAKYLKRRFEIAAEVTSRMDKETFAKFQLLVDNFVTKYKIIRDIVSNISTCLCSQKNSTESVAEEMKKAYLIKERIYRYQEYAIQKNFLRGREAMEERTLTNVANAYGEFSLLNFRRVKRLAFDNDTSDEAREQLYKLTIDALQTRQDICEMARDNISLLLSSFINGTPIFNYKFEDLPRAHNPYIVPKPLMLYSMTYNDYMQKYVPKLRKNDFDVLYKALEMFKEQAAIAYKNRTVNESDLNYVYERFQFACRTYMFSKSVVYSLGIELPLKIINERHSDFDSEWHDFDKEVHEINQNIMSLQELIENVADDSFTKMDSVVLKLQNYTQKSEGSLLDIAEYLFSKETQFVISKVKNFFTELRTRGQAIDDLANLVLKPIFAMWTMIIDDEDSIEYYKYTSNDLFLRNLSLVKEEWTIKSEEIRAGDLRKKVMNKDEDLLSAFDETVAHLYEFKKSLHVDSNFLK